MNKRGLSTIIITLILIVVSLVAVAIFWVVVRNLLQTGTEGIGLGRYTLSGNIKNVNLDNSTNNISLTVERNPGQGEINGIEFIFSDGTDSEVVKETASMKELESRKFYFHLTKLNVSNLISISIAFLIKENDKETLGDIVDKYNVAEGTGGGGTTGGGTCSPATCTSLGYECGNWGNGSCSGTLSCGTCGTGQTCNANGICQTGSCSPTTCSTLGYNCGSGYANGTCAGTLNCGTCGTGQSCTGGSCQITSSYVCGTDSVDNSCTSAIMQTLINQAVDGDTIRIATGTHNWGSVVLINKRITINGGGTCSNCGRVAQPTGTWPTRINTNGANGIFQIEVQTSGTGTVAIKGIRFYGALPISGYGLYPPYNDDAFITELPRNIANFNLNNNYFQSRGTPDDYMVVVVKTMSVETTGVISNCYFDSDTENGKHIYVTRSTYAEAQETPCKAAGQTSWTKDITFGSSTDWLFIEDCSFHRPDALVSPNFGMSFDSQSGGKIVFRHNYCYNDWVESHVISYGGYASSGVALEIYDNTAVWAKTESWQAWHYQRSGALFFYNNNVSGNYQNAVKLSTDRQSSSFGAVDGINNVDGNCQAGSTNPRATNPSDCGQAGVSYPTGYPVMDQPGRGKHYGTFSCSNPAANIQPQELLPVRFWSNTNNILGTGGACDLQPHGAFLCITNANYFAINRDYYYSADNSARPIGYTSYTYPHPLTLIS